jgi:lysyl-tRNA synthetase class 2
VSTHAPASMSAEYKIQNLKRRAELLKKARAFFDERSIMEVDCPLLSRAASVDAHIDLVTCQPCGQEAFLISSPEYAMKRLLALGIGDIYQLSHVFRDFESGLRHNPEFMMAEWYRVGISFEEMMLETCQFIQLFVGELPIETISYKDLFLRYTSINPFTASIENLLAFIRASGKEPPFDPRVNTKDDLLSFIVATYIDPHLGKGCLTCVPYFPHEQAALAKTRVMDGVRVAERFEVFCQGLELANGYHELQNPKEQRLRFEEANRLRILLGKNALPIDEAFLAAIDRMPDACGVAVGFDRLCMLHQKTNSISDVIAWDWNLC